MDEKMDKVNADNQTKEQERKAAEDDNSIVIPKIEFPGEDHQLLRRVHKFKTGSLRILIFTLVGMILGWFSIGYYTDSFIVTKVILAIPYKISEAIYVTFIGTEADVFRGMLNRMTEFFPQSLLATFLAERVTPLLIGGAIYGCLGYFTGDKKVFTLKRFIKFVSVWAVTILAFVGIVYGVNAKAKNDNSHFKNLTCFYLQTDRKAESIDHENFDLMKAAFEKELKRMDTKDCNFEPDHSFTMIFGDTRNMICYANYEQGYIWTENNDVYRVSEEFLNYIKEYEENGMINGITHVQGGDYE